MISRGERFKLVRLVINGNHYFDTEDIRDRMYMEPASFQLRHGRYSDGFLRKDEEDIEGLYRSNGFRDVKVSGQVDRDYKGKTGDVQVTLNIEEGQQWFVDQLTIQGVNQFSPEELKPQLVSVAGQAFADVNLASDRDYLLTYYYARGFPKATFQAAWQPSGTPNHVNVTYSIKEGDREFVRGVLTSGLKTTRQGYVDKRITLKPGDPLSPIQETAIQKEFYDLGVFARVDTAVQNPEGDEATQVRSLQF